MIIGHQRQIEYLNKSLKRGLMPHAYLFYGPENIGKFTIAQEIANKLCQKQDIVIIDLDHPLTVLKEERKEISIEDIRELKRIFSFKAPENSYRAVIINDADKMSQEAANAFLKLLEEPGGNTLIIMISASPDSLLQTIISRAQPIRFTTLSDAILSKAEVLKNQNEAARIEIIKYSYGRPGRMIRLINDSVYLEQARKLDKAISIVMNGSVPDMFIFSSKIAENKDLTKDAILNLLSILRSKLVNSNEIEDSIKFVQKIKKIDGIIWQMETTNVNRKLALDNLFLEIV